MQIYTFIRQIRQVCDGMKITYTHTEKADTFLYNFRLKNNTVHGIIQHTHETGENG